MDIQVDHDLEEINFEKLAKAIVNMEEDKTSHITRRLIEMGKEPKDILEFGITAGILEASRLFEEEEYFITEMLLCADAVNVGLDVLRPYFQDEEIPNKGHIVIGVIEGDTHDIGKNIVSIMLKGAGFAVLDLGRDVSPRKFVDEAIAFNADIIAVSALMTTTMENIGKVIDLLKKEGLRERFKVICGGKPLSPSFAKRIGADGYSAKANGAVQLALRIIEEKNKIL